MSKKRMITFLTLAATVALSACSTTDETETTSSESNAPVEESDMGHMMHDNSGEIPEVLEEAQDPMYEIGDTIMIETGHMAGMEGAEGIIVGAFDTVAYEVSYDPTNGEERVENHKWVVQEEITEASDTILEPGTEVTLEAMHMEGMERATATIDAANETTVYMVDYQPTDNGEVVKNHKWLTEEELASVE
ncbi:YdhK family protein [Desemzia sp. RIT804]|uniref:YdhK family protein n=1 Tax=Desemzia sp. RIT 804 TaxID=2810209 RepID=UPI00194FC21E|nr:YdhK family protein [Desemzia sp. RIT 804]MBM6614777.1 YdhK family protein [Desemzia sp. RIT 804]